MPWGVCDAPGTQATFPLHFPVDPSPGSGAGKRLGRSWRAETTCQKYTERPTGREPSVPERILTGGAAGVRFARLGGVSALGLGPDDIAGARVRLGARFDHIHQLRPDAARPIEVGDRFALAAEPRERDAAGVERLALLRRHRDEVLRIGERPDGIADRSARERAAAIELAVRRLGCDRGVEIRQRSRGLPRLAGHQPAQEVRVRAVDELEIAVEVGSSRRELPQVDPVDRARLEVLRTPRCELDRAIEVRDLLLARHAALLTPQRREVLAVRGVASARGQCERDERGRDEPDPRRGPAAAAAGRTILNPAPGRADLGRSSGRSSARHSGTAGVRCRPCPPSIHGSLRMKPLPLRIAALGAVLLLVASALGCSPRAAQEPWQVVELPTDASFDGIWFTDSLNGWIAGGSYQINGGIVGRTRDGGRTWTFRSGLLPSPAGTQFSLHRLQFRDTLHGVAACDAGVVLVTDDGGVSWRDVHHGRSMGDGLFDVQFIDGSRGWAAGASILGTRDGGESWGALAYATSENGYLSGTAIHFVDEDHGWLAGQNGLLMRSSNGGSAWTRVALPLGPEERPHLFDIDFCDAAHGWVVGENGVVLHTADGGASWSRQQDGIPIERAIPKGEPARSREILPELEEPPAKLFLTSVHFADPWQGCAVGSYRDVGESVVLRTRDGGDTWRIERTVAGEELRATFMSDSAHAWAVGDRVREGVQKLLRYAPGGS